jgi:hypothetical protein
MAYLKTEAYGYALADSSKAIELDPHYLKVIVCLTVMYEH